uniref:Uncharacterized protein n=1 Tax=Arundo donax TaxID=35708 RepID=A0A0A9FWR2_ARUDO
MKFCSQQHTSKHLLLLQLSLSQPRQEV